MLLNDIKLADIARALPGSLLIVAADGTVVDADATGWEIFGGKALTLNSPLQGLFIDPNEKMERYLGMCRRNRQAVPGKFSVQGSDGVINTYMVRGAAIAAANPGEVCLHLEDVTASSNSRRFILLNQTIERLRVEIKTRQRVEAVLEAEKQTLASVFDGKSLIDSLNILANTVEKHSEGMLVSILLMDENQCLRHAAAPSLPKDYIEAIDGVAVGPNVGSCGTAAYTKTTVIAADIATDPRWADYRELALSAKLHACWSAPIISSDGNALGTLALYYRAVREPLEDELRLIDNSAYVASIAIERFRSQESLKESLAREHLAREEAEAQNLVKDEFLAMLGHELRNPLSAINNATLATHAIINKGTTGDSDRLIQIILHETQLLKRILDDLLDISRLSRGKLQLQMEQFSLDEFADKLVTSVLACYPDRKIHFAVEDSLGPIMADSSRVRQSLQNLIDNAIKYSSKDDEVSVAIGSDVDNAIFEVIDTGRGIDNSQLASIFEPFAQFDVPIARSNSGLGLGLALVKRFANMHGGEVTASSEGAGRGSRFTLTIPRGNVDVEDLSLVQSDDPAVFERKRVLVVEDNDSAREGLCELLQFWGHEVLAAADGRQALKIIHEACPQVALVDIGLPILDGYAVAKSVRQTLPASVITLVALTGYGQDSDRDRALESGFDRHLVKPAGIDDLIEIFGEPS